MSTVYEAFGYINGVKKKLGFYRGSKSEIKRFLTQKVGRVPTVASPKSRYNNFDVINLKRPNENHRERFIKFLKESKVYEAYIYNSNLTLDSFFADTIPFLYIENAFISEHSPEGKDFWEEVNRKWIDNYLYGFEDAKGYNINRIYLLKGFLRRNHRYIEFCRRLGAENNSELSEVYERFIKFSIKKKIRPELLIWFGAISFNMNEASFITWRSYSNEWEEKIG